MAATKPYFVYILECSDGTFYTGITDDIVRRVREHNGEGTGGAKYTRSRRPVVLRFKETCWTRSEAQKREYALKQLPRAKKVALISLQKRTK